MELARRPLYPADLECQTPPDRPGRRSAFEKTAESDHQRRRKITETTGFNPDIEALAQRVKQTSDRLLELGKQNGLVWLEAYEKMLNGVLKLQQKTAKDLGQDWISTLVSTQTDVVREMSEAFLSAMKDRLK
jgi:hypothetical protein